MAAVDALIALAEELASSGAPLGAIKCLEAVAQSQGSVVPVTSAQARLRLAQLLLLHTDSVEVAKAHLERAHVLVAPLASCEDLKCRLLSCLATCYRLSGPSRATDEGKALQQGHETALACARKKKGALAHGAAWPAWALHFTLRTASLRVRTGDLAQALERAHSARRGAHDAGDPLGEVASLAAAAQVTFLSGGDPTPLLVEAEAVAAQQGLGVVVHLQAVKLLHALSQGYISPVEDCLGPMDTLLASPGDAASSPAACDLAGLPPPGLMSSLLHFARSACSRCCEKPSTETLALVRGELDAIQEVCVAQLASMQVDVQTTRENAVSPRTAHLAGPYLILHLAASESHTRLALLTTNLAAGAAYAAAGAGLCARWPHALAPFAAEARLACALYAHAVGDYQVAVALCLAAEKTARTSTRAMCVGQRALSLLCAGGPTCAGAALEALGEVDSRALETLGLGAFALHQLAASLAAIRQGGDVSEAKMLLSRCLKHAHSKLKNHEVVTQILAAMVPLALGDGDTGQAKAMSDSVYSLSNKYGDTAGELAAFDGWRQAAQAAGDEAKAAEHAGQARRKRAKLEKSIQAARESGSHEAAMGLDWGKL